MTGYAIETRIDDLTCHRRVTISTQPDAGEVIARLDLAAITANNVTYAVHHGPPLHYGRFFPTTDPASVTVPLWGFATIIRSRADAVREGDRFYGYWPAASHVRLRPCPLRNGGFNDTAPHRAAQAPVYNAYIPASAIAAAGARAGAGAGAGEAFAALFRPLFGTAFALDDALGTAPAAATVILTSASSKTAIGTGWLLRRRPGLKMIGLTSKRNMEFTISTNSYDTVLSYDMIGNLVASAPAVLVDFAGNGALKSQLHGHLSGLVASHIVGDTHWAAPQASGLPGPAPALFFAPDSIAAMIARNGAAAFHADLARAISLFAGDAEKWLAITPHRGVDGFADAFDPLVGGHADPARGHIWTP